MKRIFIDGLSGMAQGLFATLIIGTIIQQIGMFVGGNYGDLIYLIGKVAAALTGAGIGVGVARKLEAQQLVTVCAAVAGMIGAFAGKILAGQVLVDGNIVLAGPGEPLGAFVAAYVAIEIGILVTGRTKLDIILTPLICISDKICPAWYSKQTLGSTLIYHNINQKICCRCQDDRHTKADNIGWHYGM